MGFFDSFDRFYSTSKTAASPARLNGRYQALIAGIARELAGKRVLDIASHDGRWTFAALKAGAANVIGVEPRPDLVEHANNNLVHYGAQPSSYRFICGDAFEAIAGLGSFDVVLCAGFYYHTIRHVELFDLMERTGAGLIAIDTAVAPSIRMTAEKLPENAKDYTRPLARPYFIQLSIDSVQLEANAFEDALTKSGQTIVGRPSVDAMAFIAEHFGFSTERFNWPAFIAARPEMAIGLADYSKGWRQTFYCRRKASG